MTKKSLSKEEILHLGKLSNLQLRDDEVEKYDKQLSETLDYVKNLEELDTSNTEPSHSVVDLKNEGFEDPTSLVPSSVGGAVVNDRLLSQDDAMKNAKKKKNGYFIVGKILDKPE